MKTLYVDMDGVLVDFESGIRSLSLDGYEKYKGKFDECPHIFSYMTPIDGALEAYHKLAKVFDTYILSTAPWHNTTAANDKLAWVKKYLPEVAHKRLILTHHKDLLMGDYLIDDRTFNGAAEFTGQHIHFGSEQFPNWDTVLDYLSDKHE